MKSKGIIKIILILIAYSSLLQGKDFDFYDSKFHYTDHWGSYNGNHYKKTSRFFGFRLTKDPNAKDINLYSITHIELQSHDNWNHLSGVWYRTYLWDEQSKQIPQDTIGNYLTVSDNLLRFYRRDSMLSDHNWGNTFGRYSPAKYGKNKIYGDAVLVHAVIETPLGLIPSSRWVRVKN